MLCANPDRVVIDRGLMKMHAGAMADRYEALGGRVHYHGKPHAPVFRRSVDSLGVAPARVLVVGANRATDVAGAVAAGPATRPLEVGSASCRGGGGKSG